VTVIVLPWPERVLFGHAKGHWRPRHRATKQAKVAACNLGKVAGLHLRKWPADPVLTFTYHPPSLRGDVQNVHGALKAAIDGLALAMGVDDKLFRCRFPDVFDGVRKPGQVVVEVDTQHG